jgi:hypothetical protein
MNPLAGEVNRFGRKRDGRLWGPSRAIRETSAAGSVDADEAVDGWPIVEEAAGTNVEVAGPLTPAHAASPTAMAATPMDPPLDVRSPSAIAALAVEFPAPEKYVLLCRRFGPCVFVSFPSAR